MKLTIQEIADWKEKGVLPQRLIKTHDGTSMGKINQSLNAFAHKYIGEIASIGGREHLQIYDKDGKPYFNRAKVGGNFNVPVPMGELIRENVKNVHLTHNHTTLLSDGLPTMLSKADTDILLEKNMDSDYLFQSITATTPTKNNSKITLLRNNKFSTEDHSQFRKATEKMRNEYTNYRNEFQLTVKSEEQKMIENFRREHGEHSMRPFGFHDDAVKKALEKCGTLDQHFKETGVYEDIEKANCKLRVTKQ